MTQIVSASENSFFVFCFCKIYLSIVWRCLPIFTELSIVLSSSRSLPLCRRQHTTMQCACNLIFPVSPSQFALLRIALPYKYNKEARGKWEEPMRQNDALNFSVISKLTRLKSVNARLRYVFASCGAKFETARVLDKCTYSFDCILFKRYEHISLTAHVIHDWPNGEASV